MGSKLFKTLVFVALIATVQACSTSKSAINPNVPHTYHNSYQEVVDAAQLALQRADMRVIEANQTEAKEYHVHYYQQRYDAAGSNNPDGGLGADLYITRISNDRTKVVIKEEEQPSLIPGSHRETLGKDLLRELNKILVHESEVEKE